MVAITKNDIERARLVSIIDYIDKTGMGKLTQNGKYYRLHYAGHDSIVIDSEKNRFYHNSTNEKNYNNEYNEYSNQDNFSTNNNSLEYKIKNIIAIILTFLILFLLWQIPFIRNFIYNFIFRI